MIENEIFQLLNMFLFGLCVGVLLTIWYVMRILKGTGLRILTLISARIKPSDISMAKILKGINTVIDKSLEEVERGQKKDKKDNKTTRK